MDFSMYLAAGATVTKAVDFIRNAFDPGSSWPHWSWNVAAFGFGTAIAYSSQLDIFPGHPLSRVITGLAIGAASSGFHEVFDFFSSRAKTPVVTATRRA